MQRRTVAAAVSLRARVVARCGARRPAMATMHWGRPKEESWVHAATVRESADPIEVLYGSCNGESSGLSLLSVACVSHAWVTRPEDFGRMNKRGPNRRPRSSLPLDFLGSHVLYSVS